MIEELFTLSGRIAFVTGASSGIGLHIARTFAAAGAAVALASRRHDLTRAAAVQLQEAGHKAAAVYLDVADVNTIGPAFDAAERALGAPANVLVNNAGVLHSEGFLAYRDEDLDRVIDTNLKGAFRVAREAGQRMQSAGGGSIINVASTAGLRAGGSMSGYAASKAGLIQLSQVMALELAGKNIRVNVVCPGNIDTDMQSVLADYRQAMLKRTPMRRFGSVEDLDGPFLLLASQASRYMTGSVITVDGGQLLSWM